MASREEIADSLRKARRMAEGIKPIRHQLDDHTIESAYAVQRLNMSASLAAGRRPIGWKVGLTAEAVQAQLGVDQPDFGPLFADMAVADDGSVELSRMISPRVEAEVAFVLGSDLSATPVTVVDVVRATDFLLPAIEIVDSRVLDWDISIIDTIADDASSGLFVVGSRPTRLSQVDLSEVAMTLSDESNIVSQGVGADCLGNPVNAVVWLANVMAELGSPLAAGQVVLSGALGPMHSVAGPARFTADLGALGSVRVRFR